MLFFLIIGAVGAASNGNVTAVDYDSDDNVIAQHLDAVDANTTENNLKMEADAPDNVLKDSGTTTVNNWGGNLRMQFTMGP